MLPCSTLRHVWVPKRAKHNASWTTCTGCVQKTHEYFCICFRPVNFSWQRGTKKQLTPVNYWPLKHHQEPSQGLTCPTAGKLPPTGPGPREMPWFLSLRLLEEVHRLSLPAGPYWSTKSLGDVNSENMWKWLPWNDAVTENKQIKPWLKLKNSTVIILHELGQEFSTWSGGQRLHLSVAFGANDGLDLAVPSLGEFRSCTSFQQQHKHWLLANE